jgi:hypothetical protein
MRYSYFLWRKWWRFVDDGRRCSNFVHYWRLRRRCFELLVIFCVYFNWWDGRSQTYYFRFAILNFNRECNCQFYYFQLQDYTTCSDYKIKKYPLFTHLSSTSLSFKTSFTILYGRKYESCTSPPTMNFFPL